MSPRLRKFALTAHVVSSVGWFGAVVVFLALSIAGMTGEDPEAVRAAYLAMESIGLFVLVPFSIASLLTGLVQSLGTTWGLVRHYWILAKLLINVVASLILLMYTQTLASLADVASTNADLGVLRSPSPVLHSVAGLVLLLAAAVLSVYKPRGMTRYGWRKQQKQRQAAQASRRAPVRAI
jgi:ABC-type transport system involved in multi-copper enzyme maturation permease subunit